jgi:hypothetical protein
VKSGEVAIGLELIPILPQFAARQITFLPPSKNSTGKGTTQLSVCVDPKYWPVNHSKPVQGAGAALLPAGKSLKNCAFRYRETTDSIAIGWGEPVPEWSRTR